MTDFGYGEYSSGHYGLRYDANPQSRTRRMTTRARGLAQRGVDRLTTRDRVQRRQKGLEVLNVPTQAAHGLSIACEAVIEPVQKVIDKAASPLHRLADNVGQLVCAFGGEDWVRLPVADNRDAWRDMDLSGSRPAPLHEASTQSPEPIVDTGPNTTLS